MAYSVSHMGSQMCTTTITALQGGCAHLGSHMAYSVSHMGSQMCTTTITALQGVVRIWDPIRLTEGINEDGERKSKKK